MLEWGWIEWLRAYILFITTFNLLLVIWILKIILNTFKIIKESAEAVGAQTINITNEVQ